MLRTAGNLPEADVWLVRFDIKGSRRMVLDDGGAALTPSFELGLRLDGGNAKCGSGADVGGGLTFIDPERGVTLIQGARPARA